MENKFTKTYTMKQSFLILCALFVGIISLNAQEENEAEKTTCGGTDRWSVKVLTDAAASSVNYTPVISTVTALNGLTTSSVSPSTPRISGLEYVTYKLFCNIIAKRDESDNDYHLTLSDGTNTMVGEIPDPVCSQAASSTHVSQFIACRNFVDTYVGTGTHYSVSIAPVVVTGVAFTDYAHGVSGAAPNNIELHPILDIHFGTALGTENITKPVLNVSVGPNPFRNNLSIKATTMNEEMKNCYIQLYDIHANKVVDIPLTTTNLYELEANVKLPDLPKGIYIYRLMNNGELMYDGKLVCE